MGKIKFFLKHADSENESIIFLVYRSNYQYFKYYTTEYADPGSWDFEKQRPIISRKYPKNTDVDRQLSKYEFFLNDLINELKRKKTSITHELLKSNLDKEFKTTRNNETRNGEQFNLTQYIESYIQSCKEGKRLTPKGTKYQNWTIKGYSTLLFHLKAYITTKHKIVDFKDITVDFYDDIMLYFHDNKYATNTIGKHIKNLKVIMRAALDEGIHNNIEFQRKKFRIVTEESDTIYLTEEEIEKIYKLDLSKNNRLEKVRDLFIVAVRTALRFSDLVNLKENNFIQNSKGSFLKVNTQKTREEVIVPLKREVVEIFNKYKGQLPRNISNQKMNEYLKEIGKKAEIKSKENKVTTKGGMRIEETFEKWELLTTHTARRSAATNLYLAGFPSISIMKLTGHRTEK
jgi:integrase